MITALIIDDEKSGRETLAFLLERHFPGQVQVLATGLSVKEGIDLVKKHHPSLIFLDMEMPGTPGLSLLKEIGTVDLEVIVTTAHRDYGIDALKAGVCDYLLKPVDVDELGAAIKKVDAKLSARQEELVFKKIMNSVGGLNQQKSKVSLLIGHNKTVFVEAESIVRCEADGNYTKIWFTTGKMELVTKLIREMEDTLASFNFFRIHKSHLVNLEHVKAYLKSDDVITMTDDAIVPLSRNSKADFLKRMNL
ncbi:MAG: LytR/AlgR family response regulator transcription factor [Bacteroidia bacterium]